MLRGAQLLANGAAGPQQYAARGAIEVNAQLQASTLIMNLTIRPGWHMNKKHWNTVEPDGIIADDLIKELIDHSYDLVFKSLKKADRDEINDS